MPPPHRSEWPPALVDELGAESPDFVVRTPRCVRRRSCLDMIGLGVVALLPAVMVAVLPVSTGGDGIVTGLVVGGIFAVPGLAFIAVGSVHLRRAGGWFAGTATRFILLRGEEVSSAPWVDVVPILSVRHDGAGRGTVFVGEGRARSVAEAVVGPGTHIADIEDADAVAHLVWRRLAPALGEPDVASATPSVPLPAALARTVLGEQPDFVAKATRSGFVGRGALLGVGLVALGLIIAALGLLSHTGHIEMSSGEGDDLQPVPPGSFESLAVAMFGLGFSGFGSLFLVPALVLPLRRGPWFAGTPRGLIVAKRNLVRRYGWNAFEEDVGRPLWPLRTVRLDLRPGMGGMNLSSSTTGQRPQRTVAVPLIGCKDVYTVEAAVRSRMRQRR